jgi:hypothetical protein
MIPLDLFERYIAAKRAEWQLTGKLQALGICTIGFWDQIEEPENVLLEAVFNEAQRETLSWWLYESPNGIDGDPEKPHMWEIDGPPIYLRNARELWEYLRTEEGQ